MKNIKYILISVLFSIIGYFLLVFYILNASEDIICSDYIRIINYYLNDVFDLHLLFSLEGISRIPITFLMRIINVVFFNYSVYFDKIIGLVGLVLLNVTVLYFLQKNLNNYILKLIGLFLISIIIFSLMSWEMILNGTGYAHFISIGLYTLLYYIYTFLFNNTNKKYCLIIFYISLILVSLVFAGPYMIAPLISLIFISLLNLLIIKKKSSLQFIIILFVNGLLNYILIFFARYKFLNDEYGMSSRYYIQYMLLTFSIVLAILTFIDKLVINNKDNDMIYKNVNNNKFIFRYIAVILISIICIVLYIISSNTGEALIPVGIQNITLTELFKSNPLFIVKFIIKSLASSLIGVETYSYSLQMHSITDQYIYIMGIVYFAFVFLCFVLIVLLYLYYNNVIDLIKNKIKNINVYMFKTITNIFLLYVLTIILAGHMLTNYTEISKMPVRKYIYKKLVNITLYLENTEDKELPNIYEYKRDVNDIKNAINILKKNKLNVFSRY